MAFTEGNDINILQITDSEFVGAGVGNDLYILAPDLLSDTQEITISDASGNNSLQLIGGLTIASSKIAANTVQLTLSNGAKITILNAANFSYEIGGNPLENTPGTQQDFSSFVTNTLGAASVPVSGVIDGAENVTINSDGSSSRPGADIILQPGTTDPVTADSNADEVFSFNIAQALSITDNTQITLNDFDVLNDKLKIDAINALGVTTLDQLNGYEGISVTTDEINTAIVVNFGQDADNDVVILSLTGITDASLVEVNVI